MSKATANVEPIPLTDAQQIDGLREAVRQLGYENGQLKQNVKVYEGDRNHFEKNAQHLKDQITDLQAQLIKSQDRVTELQGKLLAVRAAVM